MRRKANERLADLIDPNRVLRETAQIAYSDLREVFDDQGRVKPINQWPAHVAATIAAVEVVKRNVYSNDDQVDDVIKIKVWDKPKALEMLGRHLSLFKDQIEVNVTGVVEARLHAARERLAKAKRG